MSGDQQRRQRKQLALYIVAALLVGFGGWFSFVLIVAVGLSRPWPMDLKPEDFDFNPTSEDLAAMDASLRLLEAAMKDRGNVVFSPLLVSEGLDMIYRASRGDTAAQIDRLLVDPAKFEGLKGHHIYSKGKLLESLVPGMDWIEEHSNIFGLERSLSLAPGRDVKLDEWFRWSDATARAFERGEAWQGVEASWLERSFTDQTRAGVTRLGIANDGAGLMDLETTLYTSSLWSWHGTHKGRLSAGPGLAPFHVNDTTTMVPTVCTLNWDWSGALVNQDSNATVIRWNVWSAGGGQLWIMTDLHPSADESTAPLFSVGDMEHWLYIEKVGSSTMADRKSTQWRRIQHVHFPRFTISSEIDLKKLCREMGADRAFNPEFSKSFRFAGERAYVDEFYSKLTISVDENGIGAGPTAAPVTTVLTCETPELVVNRPFVFMQTDYHELLLVGHVETLPDQ